MTAHIDGVDRTNRKLSEDPIAIVGLSCLFPMAENKSQFWANIVDGRDCLDDVPESHWRIDDYYDSDPTAEDKTYSRRGGFIPTVDFDPLEFGIPPNILGVTDVLQLLSLGVARDVLHDAGCPDAPWYRPGRTGVALGVSAANSLTQPLAARLQTPVLREVVLSCGLSDRDADEIVSRYKKAFPPWEEDSFPGMLGNVVAGRIANRFDLGGTNCTVDAACASSLAAVRAGVAELMERRADMMIVGGCDAENTILMYMCFSKTPALSKTEKIRPFDLNADGTVIGEGIGMLAIKRLADAERDGDRIYSVLCGIGSSSDGRFKSIYAPRASGQALAIKRAYEDADCTPNDIGLVEAHGTGTVAGDAVEVSALTDVYTEAGCEPSSVALGSIKSQIGHTKAAAGAAGLIKMSLALHHRVLPPTINVTTPNTTLAGDGSVFYPNVVARPWLPRTDGAPRRAAVSSFGFGGTNFHCVLQETSASHTAPSEHDVARVALWSAPDKEALIASIRSSEPLDGGAIDANHARLAFVHTGGDFADRRAQAITMLTTDTGAEVLNHPNGIFYRRTALAGSNRVAVAFPGQGSQHVNMGRSAALAIPEIRDAFAEADGHFTDGPTVGAVAFPAPVFSTEQRAAQEEHLRRTQYAQPAIGALSAGYYRHLRQLGLSPEAFIGHSYGELTALWAAEAITDEAYFQLSAVRGAAMAQPSDTEADRGAMISVKAGGSSVKDLVNAHADVFICNLNAPDQTVVGGGTEAILRFAAECERQGLETRKLPVSAAFHTPYMEHAREAFGSFVDEVRIGAPKAKVYCNVAGASYGSDEAANRQLLVRQLVDPVQFSSNVTEMYAAGLRVFLEVGPKHVLGNLLEANLGGATDFVVISTDNGRPETSDIDLRKAIAQLLVAGVPLTAVNRHYHGPTRRPTPKNTYPLTGTNFVPDRRRVAYQEALAAPFSVNGASPAEVANATPAIPQQQLEIASAAHDTVPPHAGPDFAKELLAVHLDFVEGQRELTNHLSRVIDTTHSGTVDVHKASAISAVSDQSVALAGAHRDVIGIVGEIFKLESSSPSPDFASTAAGHLVTAQPEDRPALGVTEPNNAHPVANGLPVSVLSAQAAVTATNTSTPPAHGPKVGTDHAYAALLDVVVEKTGYPKEMLDADMDVEADMGIDSVKRVEILGTLRKLFPHMPEVGPEEMAELRTLADIAGLISTEPNNAHPVTNGLPVSVLPAQAAVTATNTSTPPAHGPKVGTDHAYAALLDVVVEKTGYPKEMLDADMDVEADMGIDSVKRVEILGTLRKLFPHMPEVGPEEMAELRTLADIAGLISTEANNAQPVTYARDASHLTEDADDSRVSAVEAVRVAMPRPDTRLSAYVDDAVALVIDDGSSFTSHLAKSLQEQRWRVTVASTQQPEASPSGHIGRLTKEQLSQLVSSTTEKFGRLDAVVVVAADEIDDWTNARELLLHCLLVASCAQQALENDSDGHRSAFVTVHRTRQRSDHPRSLLDGLAGLVKTLAIEAPKVFTRSVALDEVLDDQQAAELVLRELHDHSLRVGDITYDGDGGRWSFAPADAPSPATPNEPQLGLTTNDLLLVTGGGRGITAQCVTELSARTGVGLLLLGRSELMEDPEWAAGITDESELKRAIFVALSKSDTPPTPVESRKFFARLVAAREVRQCLETLRSQGSRADYIQVDICDRDAVRAALEPYRPAVTGVVHGAGILADRLITDKGRRDGDLVLKTKLDGLRNVLDSLEGGHLEHLVIFSAAGGFFGNRGQSDYAMANSALNGFARSWKHAHPSSHVCSINWGPWAGGMVTDDIARMFEARGVQPIPLHAGARHFAEQFHRSRREDVVTIAGPWAPGAPPTPDDVPNIVAVERELSSLKTSPVLCDHRLGGTPVLPATVALGACVNVLEGLRPRSKVTGGSGFTICRGVVFDDASAPKSLVFNLESDSEADAVSIRVTTDREPIAPVYTTTLSTERRVPMSPVQLDLPTPMGPCDSAELYETVLFHGPGLRGIRRVLDETETSMVLECVIPEDDVVGIAYFGDIFDPVLSDVMLQSALVQVHRRRGNLSLPTQLGAFELVGKVRRGEPFAIVVEGPSGSYPEFAMDVTACTFNGDILAKFCDVICLSTPNLGEKFFPSAADERSTSRGEPAFAR